MHFLGQKKIACETYNESIGVYMKNKNNSPTKNVFV